MGKTGFWRWFLWRQDWEKDTYEVTKDKFFAKTGTNIPINTPLVWTKDVIMDTYKVTMDIYKESVVILATALVTSALLIFNKDTKNLIYLLPIWLIIIVIWVILYYKMKYKLAYKDIMLEVIFDHDCTKNQCMSKHFPKNP